MDLFCVLVIFVGTSVAMKPPDPAMRPVTEYDIASSPLIQQLLDRVDMLEQQGAKQADEIQSLKAELSQQRGYFKTLRSKLNAKDKLIQNLLKRISKSADDESDNLADSEMTSHPEAEVLHNGQIRDNTKRIIPVQSTSVAFYAVHPVHTDLDNTIVFDTVVTNLGNAYNASSGVFTAPVSGVYMISVNLMSPIDITAYIYMRLFSGSWKLNQHGKIASLTSMYYLMQGFTVSIHEFVNGQNNTYNIFSSFSGNLLYQTHPSTGSSTVVG